MKELNQRSPTGILEQLSGLHNPESPENRKHISLRTLPIPLNSPKTGFQHQQNFELIRENSDDSEFAKRRIIVPSNGPVPTAELPSDFCLPLNEGLALQLPLPKRQNNLLSSISNSSEDKDFLKDNQHKEKIILPPPATYNQQQPNIVFDNFFKEQQPSSNIEEKQANRQLVKQNSTVIHTLNYNQCQPNVPKKTRRKIKKKPKPVEVVHHHHHHFYYAMQQQQSESRPVLFKIEKNQKLLPIPL